MLGGINSVYNCLNVISGSLSENLWWSLLIGILIFFSFFFVYKIMFCG